MAGEPFGVLLEKLSLLGVKFLLRDQALFQKKCQLFQLVCNAAFTAGLRGNCTPVAWRDVSYDYVNSRIGKAMDPQLYFDLRDHIYADFNYMRLTKSGLTLYDSTP